MTTASLPIGPPKPLSLSLDEHGHISDVTCTWAPPASPTQSNHHHPLHQNPLHQIPEFSNPTAGELFAVDSPAKDFPPLYTLPRRSSHSYENECQAAHHHHHHPHHCEGAPPKEEVEPQQFLRHQRTNSWTMEDQKRVQHMKLMYGEAQEGK